MNKTHYSELGLLSQEEIQATLQEFLDFRLDTTDRRKRIEAASAWLRELKEERQGILQSIREKAVDRCMKEAEIDKTMAKLQARLEKVSADKRIAHSRWRENCPLNLGPRTEDVAQLLEDHLRPEEGLGVYHRKSSTWYRMATVAGKVLAERTYF
jgi:hypothetical protein